MKGENINSNNVDNNQTQLEPPDLLEALTMSAKMIKMIKMKLILI